MRPTNIVYPYTQGIQYNIHQTEELIMKCIRCDRETLNKRYCTICIRELIEMERYELGPYVKLTNPNR